MKFALPAALAASLALSAIAPSAALASDPIVVKSHHQSAQALADEITADLNAGFDNAWRGRMPRNRELYGLTAVTFQLDSAGQVSNVQTAHRSGNTGLDAMVRAAARRIAVDRAALSPRFNRVKAYMIVAPDAQSEADYADQVKALEYERRMDLRGSGTELVLTLPVRTVL